MVALGVVLGLVVTLLVVAGLVLAPPRFARGLAGLAFATLLGLIVLARPTDAFTAGFAAAYLVTALAAGALCSLPRLVRWRGAEPAWASLGLGALAVIALVLAGLGLDRVLANLLPGAEKAVASTAMSNTLLFALLPALGVATWWGARVRAV